MTDRLDRLRSIPFFGSVRGAPCARARHSRANPLQEWPAQGTLAMPALTRRPLALALAAARLTAHPAAAQLSRPLANAAQAAAHASRSHFAGRVAHVDREGKGGSMVTG